MGCAVRFCAGFSSLGKILEIVQNLSFISFSDKFSVKPASLILAVKKNVLSRSDLFNPWALSEGTGKLLAKDWILLSAAELCLTAVVSFYPGGMWK